MERGPNGRGYRSEIHRDDGAVLCLPGYDRKWRIPHDLAHLVAERELGLDDGVFGSIAAGAVFENMTVLSGRQRHDARERSRRVLRANERATATAEVLAGVVHHAAESGGVESVGPEAREAWGVLSAEPFPYPPRALRRAVGSLMEAGERWARIGEGQRLELEWPSPGPRRQRSPRAKGSKRSRHSSSTVSLSSSRVPELSMTTSAMARRTSSGAWALMRASACSRGRPRI